MEHQERYQPIGEVAKVGDLVFARPSAYHRFGRVIEVTATSVTYRSIPTEREISVPAEWLACWRRTDKGRCLVVQDHRAG
jgi:hypothetical protein